MWAFFRMPLASQAAVGLGGGRYAASMSDGTWIDWSALHERIPEEEQASFQQAFMQLALPDPGDEGDVPLMHQMVEDMQAVLQQLEQEGRVRHQDGKVLIHRDLIPESFQRYI